MAIAFDNSGSGNNTSTSLSFSFTTSGSNRILFAAVAAAQASDGTPTPTVTYGGVSMTLMSHASGGVTNKQIFVFYLINPSSGSNTFSSGLNGSGAVSFHEAVLVSYTGAKQTSQPDSSNIGQTAPSAFTPWDTPTTVVAANCWLLSFVVPLTSTVNQTSGVQRVSITSSRLCAGDSDGTVGTGSQTITYSSGSGSPNYLWAACSVSPTSAGNLSRTLTGVGI